MDLEMAAKVANFLIDLKSDHPLWLITMRFYEKELLTVTLQHDPGNGKETLTVEIAFSLLSLFSFDMFRHKVNQMEKTLYRSIEKQ